MKPHDSFQPGVVPIGATPATSGPGGCYVALDFPGQGPSFLARPGAAPAAAPFITRGRRGRCPDTTGAVCKRCTGRNAESVLRFGMGHTTAAGHGGNRCPALRSSKGG